MRVWPFNVLHFLGIRIHLRLSAQEEQPVFWEVSRFSRQSGPKRTMPRVADGLFRRDMLGPSFINLVTSITGLLLIEKLILDYVLPSWIPTIEAFELFVGKWQAVCIIAIMNSLVSFWGFGLIFALPALFKVKSWKIQINKDMDVKMLFEALPLILFQNLMLFHVLSYFFLGNFSFFSSQERLLGMYSSFIFPATLPK